MTNQLPDARNYGSRDGALRSGHGWESPAAHPGTGGTEAPYPTGAEQRLRVPVTAPIERGSPREWEQLAHLQALGTQAALENPHVRALLGTLIDRATRYAFRPAAPPPWIAQPFKAKGFGAIVTAALPAATVTNVASITPRPGYVGVVKLFGHDLDFTLGDPAWTDVIWSFLLNGALVAPYGPFAMQIGQTEAPTPLQIIVPQGQTLVIQANNTSVGNAYVTRVVATGWQWPFPDSADLENAQAHATVA